MNRILVTGGSGFLGKHVVNHLRRLGQAVEAPNSQELNLLDPVTVQAYLKNHRPTHLLHLAWFMTPGIFFESPENLHWVEATLALVRFFAESGGQRFVGAGTCFETLLPASSATFYGFCKNSTKELLATYCQKTGVEFAWGRIFFLYGPGERPERLVPSVVRNLLNRSPVACSKGEVIRDYMYVEDCAADFSNLLTGHEKGLFEIASGQPIMLKDFIGAFGSALGRTDLIHLGARPERDNEPQELVSTKMYNRGPKVGLAEGVQRTIQYWRGEI